jgi:hypothetical protein
MATQAKKKTKTEEAKLGTTVIFYDIMTVWMDGERAE